MFPSVYLAGNCRSVVTEAGLGHIFAGIVIFQSGYYTGTRFFTFRRTVFGCRYRTCTDLVYVQQIFFAG